MSRTIAIVLKGYPRLSETFIAQELLGLEKSGLALRLISLRHPTDKQSHPVHGEIAAPVSYLPEYLRDEPGRVFNGWWRSRRLPGYRQTRNSWLRDLKGDFSRNRFRRFGQALVMAAELPGDVDHIHSHFIHTPASVARYTAMLTGLSWTVSAHAKDIWTSSDKELGQKLAGARWVVTCTRSGWQHLKSLSPDPARVHLSYHGLDLSRFGPPPQRRPGPDGSDPENPVHIITVARAVEKKGLDTIISALAELPAGLSWHWHHIGAGGLVETLKAQAGKLGISDKLTWHGAMAQTDVLALYRNCDIFVLACRIAADGDRDGLPNVIVEAQSQALSVVSTTVSGVPELITSGDNGLLVAPDNVDALRNALHTLVTSPQLRVKLGACGESKVRTHFDHNTSIAQLAQLFHTVRPQGTGNQNRSGG